MVNACVVANIAVSNFFFSTGDIALMPLHSVTHEVAP